MLCVFFDKFGENCTVNPQYCPGFTQVIHRFCGKHYVSDDTESYPHFAQVDVDKAKNAVDIVYKMWKTAG